MYQNRISIILSYACLLFDLDIKVAHYQFFLSSSLLVQYQFWDRFNQRQSDHVYLQPSLKQLSDVLYTLDAPFCLVLSLDMQTHCTNQSLNQQVSRLLKYSFVQISFLSLSWLSSLSFLVFWHITQYLHMQDLLSQIQIKAQFCFIETMIKDHLAPFQHTFKYTKNLLGEYLVLQNYPSLCMDSNHWNLSSS